MALMMGSILLSSLLILSIIGAQNAPGSTMVTESGPLTINDTNKDSIFNCHHPAAGNINFRVVLSSGTDVSRQTNSGIVHNNCFQNGLRYTVTIPGQPQYYKAQVHCLLVSDAPLESPPAFTLTKTSRRTKNISIGEVATFECASCSRIDWLINGTHLRNLTVAYNDINVTSRLAADGSTRISTLFIAGRLIYNDTSIECRATGTDQHLPPVKLFVHARLCPENLSLTSHMMVNNEKIAEVILTAHFKRPSIRVSNVSTIELDSLDGLDSTQLTVVQSSYHDQTFTLVLTLARRRIWNASVVAYCKFPGIELNTHDIQNISVSSPLPGAVRVTGEFIQGSTATGVLILLYRPRDLYVTYDLISRKDMLVTDIHVGNGSYEVFAFDVEGNGTYSSATVKPIVVDVMPSDSDEVPSSPRIEYEVQNVSTGFRITCIFPDHRITECVVIVHPKFPLHHNFLSATLYHFRLGSVGNMVSGYVNVADPNDVQITVVGGTKKRTRRTSTSSIPSWAKAIIAIVSCCLSLLVLGGTVIATAKWIRKSCRKRQVIEEPHEDETQHLAAGPIEELDRNVPEPSHTDRSKQISAPTGPEEESDKEVEHRTRHPLPSYRREDQMILGDEGGNSSDNILHSVTHFIARAPSQNSVGSQHVPCQLQEEDIDDHENRSTTPPHVDDQVDITGRISRYEDSILDDDETKSEIDFALSIDVTEQSNETKL